MVGPNYLKNGQTPPKLPESVLKHTVEKKFWHSLAPRTFLSSFVHNLGALLAVLYDDIFEPFRQSGFSRLLACSLDIIL